MHVYCSYYTYITPYFYCALQLKELLDERFHSLEDFKADERYRVPHDDHRLHSKQVRGLLSITGL